MTNENDSNSPASYPDSNPTSQPPAPETPPTPPQHKVSDDPNKSTNNQNDTAKELAREFRWVEFAQLAVNGVLAVIGIFALCIYHGQLDVMRGQLSEIIKQYPELQKSAGAARDSVTQAEASSRLEQRAWVGVVSIVPPDLRPKSDFFLSLQAVNSGHTPALNFRSLTVLHSLKKTEEFKPIYAPIQGTESNRVIQPSEGVTLNTRTYELTQEQIDWIKNGNYILYVYGKMSYDDIFHQRHHTTFCKVVLSNVLVEDCGTYNTAD
jgi:hypothetical protein